eukprot:5036127-Prymnesium_polylepis.2
MVRGGGWSGGAVNGEVWRRARLTWIHDVAPSTVLKVTNTMPVHVACAMNASASALSARSATSKGDRT